MSTLAEIEAAFEQLSRAEQQELHDHIALRLQSSPQRGLTQEEFEAWLETARGAAIPGITTAQVMAETRGEE